MGKRAVSIPAVGSASVHVDLACSSRPHVLCSIENIVDRQHNRPDGLKSPMAKKQRCLELNQPTTPEHNPLDVSCLFSQARSLLRQPPACSNVAPIGREPQSKQIESAVHGFVDSGIGKSVYVSGLPGTGKSHTVRKVLQQLSASYADAATVTWVNCMSVNSSNEVYAQVAASADHSSSCAGLTSHHLETDQDDTLSCKRCNASVTTYQQLVERLSSSNNSKTPGRPAPRSYRATRSSKKQASSSDNSSSSHVDNDLASTADIGSTTSPAATPKPRSSSSSSRRHIIVLDEIDNLAKKSTAALVQLFLLPYEPGLQVLLLGIANSIDLTERALPALKMKMVTPELICFPAYSTKQLMAILSACMEAMPCKLFEPPAVELCARSVATSSGDLRHALKACRAAVDELERQHKQQQQQQQHAPSAAAAMQEVPTVTARYMIGALKQLASGSVRSSHFGAQATNSIRSLPNQQQLLLYSLSVLCKPKDALEDAAADQQQQKKQKNNASSLWKAAGSAMVHSSAGSSGSKTPGKKLGAGSAGNGSSQQVFVLSVGLEEAYTQYKQVCNLLSLPPCTRPELLHMAELLSLGHTGVALVEVLKPAGGSSSAGLGSGFKVGRGKGGLGGLGGRGFGGGAASLGGNSASKSCADVRLSLKASVEEVEAALQHNPALRCLVQK